MPIVIASDNNRETMSLKYTVIIMVLLIGVLSLAGCTGSSSAPVATSTPLPAATVHNTPVPSAAPVMSAQWTTETPYAGHPYLKTYSFHGSGDYEDFTFSTDNDATWAFRMDPGQGYFLVSLKDAQNNEIKVLADGPGASTNSVWLRAGNYHFDIAADSPWYITMSTG
jgi:hypothetical protein